jgi:cytochrome c oxidase assembly protein subunit 15
VQLHHRIGAYLLFAGAIVMAAMAWRARYLPYQARVLALVAMGVTVMQAVLGIATLMAGVPLSLGILHQAGAVFLLAAATAFAWRVRRP